MTANYTSAAASSGSISSMDHIIANMTANYTIIGTHRSPRKEGSHHRQYDGELHLNHFKLHRLIRLDHIIANMTANYTL